ncbi:MAG: hypothetical protein K2P09_04530 [Erysipelotrichales bacterium]|nr:hypothetical protein [Erysipelotrichales bacterium]
MDKILQDIVAIDLECSRKVEEAKNKKQDVQSHMSAKKKEIYDSFVKEHQEKIAEYKQKLEAEIQATKEKNDQEYKESLTMLSDLYEKNKENWVRTIVTHCKEI